MDIREEVWVEKFRPETLEDVEGQGEITGRMKKWVNDPSCPHLLLKGPAGVGKTSSVVAFAKEKYGENWDSNLIEMNASDERGIDIVRDKIKKVARESPTGGYSFKIIFLDEVDNLTKDAQQALRRTMERFSDQTRFFLSCNYLGKIIDPIQSRCTLLPFNHLSDNDIKNLLSHILEGEGIEYESSAVQKIIDYVDGDARRAVQSLQTSVDGGELTEDVLDIVGAEVGRELLDELVDDAVRGNMEEVHENIVKEVLPNVIDYGIFCSELQKAIRDSNDVRNDVRWYMVSRVAELERNIEEGLNPNVQCMSFFAEIPVIQNSSIPNYD